MGGSFILYSRPAELPELWEQICVGVGGHRGEAVGASVRANVRYGGSGGLGLVEAKDVMETGSPAEPPLYPASPKRLLQDHEDALLWERQVAEICPDRARAFAREKGHELLSQTADARQAAGRYLELFGTRDWRELRVRLERRATAKEIREADQIATTPPTIGFYNGREFYTTIILGIILYSGEVEGREIAPPGVCVWPDYDPHSNAPPDWSQYALAWRIDILADRMLSRYPLTTPSRIED